MQAFKDKTGTEFEPYYKKYRPKLLRFLTMMCSDKDDANDVVDEAFTVAINKLDSYDPTKAVFSTWLYTIAKRIMLHRIKNKSKFSSIDQKTIHSKNEDEGLCLADILTEEETMSEYSHMLNQKKADIVHQIIPNLPEKYSIVLTLRHVKEYSYQQIADELGFFNIYSEDLKEINKIEKILRSMPIIDLESLTILSQDNKHLIQAEFLFDKEKSGYVIDDMVFNINELKTYLWQKLKINSTQIVLENLNLNTVKSRIRQARLKISAHTEKHFKYAENLDDDLDKENEIEDLFRELV